MCCGADGPGLVRLEGVPAAGDGFEFLTLHGIVDVDLVLECSGLLVLIADL